MSHGTSSMNPVLGQGPGQEARALFPLQFQDLVHFVTVVGLRAAQPGPGLPLLHSDALPFSPEGAIGLETLKMVLRLLII